MRIEKVFTLYEEYNQAFFKGMLPPVDIAFMNIEAYGYAIPHWSGMEVEAIILAKGMTKKEIQMTLAHEMVHVWQAEQGYKSWDHNKKFYRKAKKICRVMGWNICNF